MCRNIRVSSSCRARKFYFAYFGGALVRLPFAYISIVLSVSREFDIFQVAFRAVKQIAWLKHANLNFIIGSLSRKNVNYIYLYHNIFLLLKYIDRNFVIYIFNNWLRNATHVKFYTIIIIIIIVPSQACKRIASINLLKQKYLLPFIQLK